MGVCQYFSNPGVIIIPFKPIFIVSIFCFGLEMHLETNLRSIFEDVNVLIFQENMPFPAFAIDFYEVFMLKRAAGWNDRPIRLT